MLQLAAAARTGKATREATATTRENMAKTLNWWVRWVESVRVFCGCWSDCKLKFNQLCLRAYILNVELEYLRDSFIALPLATSQHFANAKLRRK